MFKLYLTIRHFLLPIGKKLTFITPDVVAFIIALLLSVTPVAHIAITLYFIVAVKPLSKADYTDNRVERGATNPTRTTERELLFTWCVAVITQLLAIGSITVQYHYGLLLPKGQLILYGLSIISIVWSTIICLYYLVKTYELRIKNSQTSFSQGEET